MSLACLSLSPSVSNQVNEAQAPQPLSHAVPQSWDKLGKGLAMWTDCQAQDVSRV